ncbi:MAG TPA: SMC family ATPase [Planctomycetota bacterium]|nr:SMC family ATPase [Planctomycetota bacterium]
MRFHCIKMTGFKKYRKSVMAFGPGLNIFHGPNEAGKSTLHQALITGLYGVRGRGDDGLIRSKDDARSWEQTSECRIEIEYGIGESRFAVVRDVADGKLELHSIAADGLRALVSESREEVERIIAEQTGIESPYIFNRTISVCQNDLAQGSDLKRIAGNIESTFAGPDSITASNAIAFLDKEVRKKLRKVKNESPGQLDKLTERLEILISDIERVRKEEQRRAELAERIESLEARLPGKKDRLAELGQFLDKSEAKRRIEDKLDAERRRFHEMEDRIRSIEECSRKLEELEHDFDDLGPITLFDPDQLDGARLDLERARAELVAKSSACADRMQTLQNRMRAAEELSKEISVIEQQVVEYGSLARENLDKTDARRREVADRLKAAEEHVQAMSDRLEHVEHSLWGLDQFAKKHPDLGDAWQLQSEWQRLELRKDEHTRMHDHANDNLQRHEAKRFPPTFGKIWVEAPVIIMVMLPTLIALQVKNAIFDSACAAITFALAVWWVVWKTKRRSRRDQWRGEHRKLQNEELEAQHLLDETTASIAEFTAKIGLPEDSVRSFIEEYRTNQSDLKSLRREHEQCVHERDNALAAKEECEKEGRQLAESFGFPNIADLRDKIDQLRDKRLDVERLSERLAGILGQDKVYARDQMLISARSALVDLRDEKKRIEKDQMDLARHESDFLQRTSCDDILQLAERTRKLRVLQARKDKLTASMEAHAGGKTLDELKREQLDITLELKLAMARLEQDFPGFEPSVEQTELWRKEKERLEFEIPELSDKLTAARTELGVLDEHAGPSLAELEGEKQYIEAEVALGDFVVTACSVASEVLAEIDQEHHSLYLPKMQQAASEFFSRMTAGAYLAVNLVDGWPQRITAVDRTERQVDVDKLSRGTADQLYFSLRLALASALSGRTFLPMILDDPFVNFDADRFEEAVATILELARLGRQIIYLTHSPLLSERVQSWSQQGIQVNCVKLGK